MTNHYNDETLRKLIINRYTTPHHYRAVFDPQDASKILKLNSETCSDRLEMVFEIQNHKLTKMFFSGTACAIATASTDLLFDMVKDRDVADVLKIIENYELLIADGTVQDEALLGSLMAFKNVHKQKSRRFCATLASHGLKTELTRALETPDEK